MGVEELVYESKRPKAEIWGVLIGCTVAMVTYNDIYVIQVL